MKKIINLPHTVNESTCYVNGLYDVLAWKGADYSYFLLPVIGGMSSFTYLKFKLATPPCMVYWGPRSQDLLNCLGEIIGFTRSTSEGKSFKNEFPKIKAYIDVRTPVMAGAIDMYYLPYYQQIYHREHIPIHYVLIVGYDDSKEVLFLHDCTYPGLQQVSYAEFEKAMNVSTPGLSKKNSYRVFVVPPRMPIELEVAQKGFTYKASRMLQPPVKLFGIPAMRKLAADIPGWTDEACFDHMVSYAGMTPPLIDRSLKDNDAMRFRQEALLREMGEKYSRYKWKKAADLFHDSGQLILELSKYGIARDGSGCGKTLEKIADIEEKAYRLLL
jgi:hypothetical protein